jgi:Outer membrane protein Omp28/FlgD Ig-like domain
MKKYLTLVTFIMVNTVFAQTIIVTQDFETGSLPAGWTRTQNTPSFGWEFGTALGSAYFNIPTHTGYAASNDDAHDDNSTTLNDASADRLISPTMNLTTYAGSSVIVKFDYIQPGSYGSSGTVEVSTNGGMSWTPVSTVTPSAAWTNGLVNISTYTSSSSVQVAFRHNDGGAWADGFGVDNVVIQTVPAYDASATTVTTNDYVVVGNTTISGIITNMGGTNITTLEASYTIDGGSPVTQTFTGLNVALGATATISFTTPANLSLGSHNICIVTGNVNSNADADNTNNQICKTVQVLSAIPTKKTVLERHTGSWCQFCPDGEVIMSDIDNSQPNTICVAIHNSDDMDIPDGNLVSGEYISGFPGGTVDRMEYNSSIEQNRGEWEALCNARNLDIVPMGVSILDQDWDAVNRLITVTVGTDFVGSLTGDLRLNLYIVEDQVTGSGSGYNQVNYYNTVAGHPYYGAGNPIVGFVHKKVVREMLGGAWGTSGVIPTLANSGDSYSQTYTYTLPANYDENEIYLVAMVQRYDNDNTNRMIYNAEEVKLWLGTTGLENNESFDKKLYPNPFENFTRLEFELNENSNVNVDVYDLSGRKIRSLANGFMNKGAHSVIWYGDNMEGRKSANGEYIISLEVNGKVTTSKVVLSSNR